MSRPMPRLRILYDVDGWAFHNVALALQRYAPDDFSVSIGARGLPHDIGAALGREPVDLVFALPDSAAPAIRAELQRRGWSARLIGSRRIGWPLWLDRFHASYRAADAMIVNNPIDWENLGRLPRTYMIPNGVDLERYRVTQPLAQRRPRLLWTGSEFHREVKGYDSLVKPLSRHLAERGVDCDLQLVDSTTRERRSAAQMCDWYNTGTVLLCASSSEGTPNTALEAAACGCTVVSTPVGNMPQLIRHRVNGFLVEPEIDAIEGAIIDACDNYFALATAMQEEIRRWDWQARSGEFFAVFRRLLAE
jgi:glycosyltransferase involved in cell wall biosynthesis